MNVLLMLITLLFLGLAVLLLRRSYILMMSLLPVRASWALYMERGLVHVILQVVALTIWFIAGVLALTSGVTGIVNKTIFALQ